MLSSQSAVALVWQTILEMSIINLVTQTSHIKNGIRFHLGTHPSPFYQYCFTCSLGSCDNIYYFSGLPFRVLEFYVFLYNLI